MFVVCVFEDVNASGHIVVRHVKWDSFHFVFVVDCVFCQNGYEVRLANQFKQNVHLIQFDTNVEVAIVVNDAVESVSCLQAF